MRSEVDEPKLIGGNEGDLNGSPSHSTLSPAEWSATGGRRRRNTRKSRGKKSKSVGGSRRRTGKRGKKSGKSRKSKRR